MHVGTVPNDYAYPHYLFPFLQCRDPLQYLIESNRLSARSVPSLITTLSEHGKYEMIRAALVHVHDLSEQQLVQVVQVAVASIKNDTGVTSKEGRLSTEDANALLYEHEHAHRDESVFQKNPCAVVALRFFV